MLTCNPKVNNSEDDKIVERGKIINHNGVKDDILVDFFQKFQSDFNKKDLSKIISFVNFPLEGDCIYYYVFGEKVHAENFDFKKNKILKDNFRKEYDKIFNSHAKFLLSKVDFKKLILDKTYQFKEPIDANSFYEINFYNKNNIYNVSISYNNKYESTTEHSIIYQFKVINNSIKLYSIFCAG